MGSIPLKNSARSSEIAGAVVHLLAPDEVGWCRSSLENAEKCCLSREIDAQRMSLHDKPMESAILDVPACLERVRQKDDAASRRLVEHLYPIIIKIVRTKVPRCSSEEDLMQEIFLRMFAKLDQYQGNVPFEHWVSRIAVNHCLNAIRAQQSRPEWRWSDLPEEQAAAIDAAMTSAISEPASDQAAAAREIVDKLLAILSPEDQLLMRLLEMEDRTIEDVKAITGWSSTLVRVRAFRARHKLNKYFRQLKKQGKL